jgi:hypothetical protein
MKTRIIDLTDNSVFGREDVKVEFKTYERHLAPTMPYLSAIVNPDTMLLPVVEHIEAHDPLEGFTGFTDERVVILCDTSDKSADKLIALANYINIWKDELIRITGKSFNVDEKDIDAARPDISVIWTSLPYETRDNMPVAKTRKLAAALSWQPMSRNFLDIKFTALGDYSANISPFDQYYNRKKVYVDTCLTGFFSNSERAIVHTVNPISDILYSMKNYKFINDCDMMWVSPSIYSLLPSSYIEDCLDDFIVVRGFTDTKTLGMMYQKHLEVTVSEDEKVIDVKHKDIRHIVCIATSLHDFMSFQGEISMFVSNYTDSSAPIKLSLFVGYSPEEASDQRLYEVHNNFKEFLEDRIMLMDTTFYMSDIEAARLVDADSSLLEFIPKNIDIYHTKILDALC